MRVFIATLIIIAAVVFIPFLAVKFYKWEMAREKRIFEAIKARHAEQHAFLSTLHRAWKPMPRTGTRFRQEPTSSRLGLRKLRASSVSEPTRTRQP
jgi:hypothetical protein